MYDTVVDPYCYAGTTVLKNIPGIRNQAHLDAYEAVSTAQRADEPLPQGRLSVNHYRAIHHHLFQDVYSWAGKFRTVRISKDGSPFCYPEHIPREMKKLFADLEKQGYFRGIPPKGFAGNAAHFLATLNAIHPFREGNGRTQTTFLVLLGDHAGHHIELDRLAAEQFLRAMIASFKGDELPLRTELERLVTDS